MFRNIMTMARRSASEKLKLLDQHLHALVRRFYLRPLLDGPGAELSSSEFFALNILGRKGRSTMTDLAHECGLVLSSMTGVVDRLVSKGYARRIRDEEEDRRRVFVELDKKGERVYQQLLEAEMELIITMMDALEPAEQETLLHALGKAVASIGE